MTTSTHNNHIVIKADEGFFLRSRLTGAYGKEMSLGCYDTTENYDELPMSEWPEEDNGETIEIEE